MVSIKLLKKRGCSAEAWEKLFTAEENTGPTFDVNKQGEPGKSFPGDPPPKKVEIKGKINELRNRIRLRVQAGREENFRNYQIFKGVDDAFNVPLKKAVTPTLLSMLADRTGTEAELKKELSAWGFNLEDVTVEVMDTKVDGKAQHKISAPAFFQVFVPLVKAYKTIRQAKIMNDLNQTPYFEYQPAWESQKTRLQCDAITSRVEVMSSQFNYYEVNNQGVGQMLHYGRSFQFPVEEWYSEEQEVETPEEASTVEGEPVRTADRGEGDEAKKGHYYRTTKAGLRYHFAHPTRSFWDRAHAPHTFNTDTGCEFGGYWRVERYHDVRTRAGYYNTDQITIGNYMWFGSNATFFNTVYPCVMQFPSPGDSGNDRETELLNSCYNQSLDDKAVVITHYCEKLVPSEWGLGDYDHPIWVRFVLAGDDTILYAAPYGYSPVVYYGYDDDQAAAQNASLSLEILPFQDHLSNLLTQYLLVVKQNLANITFVDEDVVGATDKKVIENLGEKLFRKRNFKWFSGKKARFAQTSIPTAFYSHSFPQLDANGIVQAIKLHLEIMERTLGMSSQELGQAASHEQTKREVDTISTQSGSRLRFTTSPVIAARQAMMRQIYEASMNYDEEEFWAQIPADRTLTAAVLEKLGMTWDEEEHPVRETDRMMVVRVKKSAVLLESFAALRVGEERKDNTEMANALFQNIGNMVVGPLGPALGPEQAIRLLNLAGRMAGWPRDFKLMNVTPAMSDEEKLTQLQQQIQPYLQQIEAKIMGEVKAGIKPMLEKDAAMEKEVVALAQAMARVNQILNHASLPQPMGLPAPGAAPLA